MGALMCITMGALMCMQRAPEPEGRITLEGLTTLM
eukprot:gene36716-27201_t